MTGNHGDGLISGLFDVVLWTVVLSVAETGECQLNSSLIINFAAKVAE